MIEVRGAAVEPTLPATDLVLVRGAVRVVGVETDERPKTLSLLVGGRVRATAGEVLLDGQPDASALRRAVALVDTPFASEPSPTVSLATAVAEELAFAGRPSGRRAVAEVLRACGLEGRARDRVEATPTAERLKLLCELALLRPGIEALVITSPERHGGDPALWFPVLARIAQRDVAVLVVTDTPTERALVGLGAASASDLPAVPELS